MCGGLVDQVLDVDDRRVGIPIERFPCAKQQIDRLSGPQGGRGDDQVGQTGLVCQPPCGRRSVATSPFCEWPVDVWHTDWPIGLRVTE